jgi:hypothetical protein
MGIDCCGHNFIVRGCHYIYFNNSMDSTCNKSIQLGHAATICSVWVYPCQSNISDGSVLIGKMT